MTWTKLGDEFADECETLSLPAKWVHVEGLLWSNRKLLDCRIPKDHLRRFASHPEAVQELLDTGWWSDNGDAYVIRHHAAYQRTREQVVAQQEANAANGRRGGRPRGNKSKLRAKGAGEGRQGSETQLLSKSVSGSDADDWPSVRRPGTGRAGEQDVFPSSGATETQSHSDSLIDSKTERDRTGQDRTLRSVTTYRDVLKVENDAGRDDFTGGSVTWPQQPSTDLDGTGVDADDIQQARADLRRSGR